MPQPYDYALVGGGLQNGLIALALRAHQPRARIAMIERGAAPGGNHTWCFHAGDLPPGAAVWIEPLVVARWPGYDVAFPDHRRRLDSPYACISSERLAARVTEALDVQGSRLVVRSTALVVEPTSVVVRADGGEISDVRATVVIDARGPDRAAIPGGGWQKFVGLELRLARPHGLARPMLMDATVPQRDGSRFFYVLPLAPDRVLVEDTYFSDGTYLDVAAVREEVSAYAAARFEVAAIEREEVGVLPLPWRGDGPSNLRAPGRGLRRRLVSSGHRILAADRRAPRRAHRDPAGRPALRPRPRRPRARPWPPAALRAAAEPDDVRLVPPRPALPRARAVLPPARAARAPVLRARADRDRPRAHPVRASAARVVAARGAVGVLVNRLAQPATVPPAIAALVRALEPGGASALDATVPSSLWRAALAGPAAEFLARPGKELRAMIVRAGWVLGGGTPDAMPDGLCLVLELLHAGSLIVDDVEDDSERRRGGPALHRLIGTPLAINTGSWMYFWALAELADLGLAPGVELAAYRLAIATLVRCHQGQALDLATRITEVDIAYASSVVETITRLKTGALCRLAAELGAIAVGASSATRDAVGRFAEAIGIALQMYDDLGSITAPARRDKGREDLRAGRPTWPWAWLADHDPFAWSRLVATGRAVFAGADPDRLADALADGVAMIGRTRARATIDAALAEVAAALGPSVTLDAIAAELRRMEASYA